MASGRSLLAFFCNTIGTPQVLLLEGLHHAARPKVALPLAQNLLASLAALSLSDKGHSEEAAKQAGENSKLFSKTAVTKDYQTQTDF